MITSLMHMMPTKCIKVRKETRTSKNRRSFSNRIAGEFFTFKCNTEDLDRPNTIDHVDVNWTRVSRFAPFMKMGKSDGYLVYHCTGFKLPQGSTSHDLHPVLAKEIQNEMKSYASAADKFNIHVSNVSSWSYFRDHFDRYQNEPETVWPIRSSEE